MTIICLRRRGWAALIYFHNNGLLIELFCPFVTSEPDKGFDNSAFSPLCCDWQVQYAHPHPSQLPLSLSRLHTRLKPDTFPPLGNELRVHAEFLEINVVIRLEDRVTAGRFDFLRLCSRGKLLNMRAPGLIYLPRQKYKYRKQSHLPPSSVAIVC